MIRRLRWHLPGPGRRQRYVPVLLADTYRRGGGQDQRRPGIVGVSRYQEGTGPMLVLRIVGVRADGSRYDSGFGVVRTNIGDDRDRLVSRTPIFWSGVNLWSSARPCPAGGNFDVCFRSRSRFRRLRSLIACYLTVACTSSDRSGSSADTPSQRLSHRSARRLSSLLAVFRTWRPPEGFDWIAPMWTDQGVQLTRILSYRCHLTLTEQSTDTWFGSHRDFRKERPLGGGWAEQYLAQVDPSRAAVPAPHCGSVLEDA
ncbi:hypothetical protein JOF56_009999 [Kibdelosporangium banguiense]|uniref:Uncharacterized protein n=1 Tax=Kibdelosporangium banguiense TaxID=1365924 RepID=A0ABS4TYX4_9PSEU|nr:hypothetical protein [Kibdelosporangium banguiense]